MINISEKQYSNILEKLSEKEDEEFSFNMKILNVDGLAIFQSYEKANRMCFESLGGKYQQTCGVKIQHFWFDFKNYEEFTIKFSTHIGKFKGWCNYHSSHRGGLCPFELYSTTETETCSICQESENVLKLQKTKCGHLFHLSCLNRWAKIESRKKRKADGQDDYSETFFKCPMCREELEICYNCDEEECICD